jgi:D-amino peptidase
MKILIAADMEGISGVTHWEQVMPGNADYERYRRIMTSEVNAAIEGAFAAGAAEVSVTDGHASGRNILIDMLDPRARLNSGSPSPFSMIEGVQHNVDGVFFIGYHARAGTAQAILDHTWSSKCVAGLWLNDLEVGEIGLNAALCGHFGIPVLMISGDQSACREAKELLGLLETVIVKRATGRMSADCLPPAVTYAAIKEAASRAVSRLSVDRLARQPTASSGDTSLPQPLRLPAPIQIALELTNSEMSDRAAMMPGVTQRQKRRIEFSAPDMPAAYLAFRAAVLLAAS